ncbi:hypothetical protein EI94DRAFT_1705611 [Lactarius quietus]|nr:hypothetical protein EI94DRAFT_1705611 [Lactarius quietus]
MEHMSGGSKKPPASFNPMALRSDAVSHVAPTAAYRHVANSTAIASRSNNALEPDYLRTGKYVVLVPPHAQKAGSIFLSGSRRRGPADFIRGPPLLCHMHGAPQGLLLSVHLSYIIIMSRPTCHIGVAFFNFASYPTQWALILPENPQFIGPGWGSSPAQTVNGLGTPWVWFERSPAGFHPSGLFLGIAYVEQVSISINNMKALISGSN